MNDFEYLDLANEDFVEGQIVQYCDTMHRIVYCERLGCLALQNKTEENSDKNAPFFDTPEDTPNFWGSLGDSWRPYKSAKEKIEIVGFQEVRRLTKIL